MAKTKGKKGSGGGVNSHVRSRINYLYKAAAFLQPPRPTATTSGAPKDVAKLQDEDEVMSDSPHVVQKTANEPKTGDSFPQLARVCISQMRGVSQKTQLRLPIDQKRSFCKRCDTLLEPGTNCIEEIRNPSRGGKKPWAAVRVVRCNICATEKRLPLTDKRSLRLPERRKEKETEKETAAEEQAEEVKPA